MAPLIEAQRDGRLGQREVASLERHLHTCARCALMAQRLERIAGHVRRPRVPSTDLSHQRQRLALLRAAALGKPRALVSLGGPGPKPRGRPAWGAVALAALVLGTPAAIAIRSPTQVEASDGRIARVSVREGRVEVPHHEASPPVVASAEPPPPPPAPQASPSASSPLHPAPRPALRARPPVAAAPAKPSASKDFAEGVALIERGDYAKAADRLDAFRAAHPGDPRAEDADYLAILSLQRAGRADAVARAARRFLTLYPDSSRRGAVQRLLDDR
jgi:hypothetical protein